MAPRPLISVVLPVRNGMPYLPRAIASLLTQTDEAFEVLVVDDGSSDGSYEYVRQLADPRVRLLRVHGSGLADALNTGLAAARGPYLARQDADDWSAPARLALQRAWLDAHPDIAVLATEVAFVDGDDAPLSTAWTRQVHEQWDAAVSPDEIAALMPLTCCLFHATVMLRTAVLREAGGYDARMVPAEDYDLWLRILPSARFARLSRALYTVRVHEHSSSTVRKGDQIERVITAKLRYLRRRYPQLPRPATLALPVDDRGAAAFRRVAEAEGFAVVTGPLAEAAADVIAVTDFSQLAEWRSRLTGQGSEGAQWRGPACEQVGNLFVRVTRGEQGRPQAWRHDGQAEASAHGR